MKGKQKCGPCIKRFTGRAVVKVAAKKSKKSAAKPTKCAKCDKRALPGQTMCRKCADRTERLASPIAPGGWVPGSGGTIIAEILADPKNSRSNKQSDWKR
ncbi:hypothetical protein ABIA35_009107 [Catenulispora sp. MAP12-49]|uniref:hypothetical protein n=1 Tax=Catenulispora sp. MAP12-49 TaxID=3156302 RepID=UPI003514EC78